jgi:predicted RNase H-like nuclease (RuvC/YqgF family)
MPMLASIENDLEKTLTEYTEKVSETEILLKQLQRQRNKQIEVQALLPVLDNFISREYFTAIKHTKTSEISQLENSKSTMESEISQKHTALEKLSAMLSDFQETHTDSEFIRKVSNTGSISEISSEE